MHSTSSFSPAAECTSECASDDTTAKPSASASTTAQPSASEASASRPRHYRWVWMLVTTGR